MWKKVKITAPYSACLSNLTTLWSMLSCHQRIWASERMPTLFDFSSLLHRQAKHIEKKNFEKDKECEHVGCAKESRIQIRRQQKIGGFFLYFPFPHSLFWSAISCYPMNWICYHTTSSTAGTHALDHFLIHKHLIYPFWSIYKVHFPVLKVHHAGMSVPAELVRKGGWPSRTGLGPMIIFLWCPPSPPLSPPPTPPSPPPLSSAVSLEQRPLVLGSFSRAMQSICHGSHSFAPFSFPFCLRKKRYLFPWGIYTRTYFSETYQRALYRKSDLCIRRNETARPCS